MSLTPKTRETACICDPNAGELQQSPQGGFCHAFYNAQVRLSISRFILQVYISSIIRWKFGISLYFKLSIGV